MTTDNSTYPSDPEHPDHDAYARGQRIGRHPFSRIFGPVLKPILRLALAAFYLFGIVGMMFFLMVAFKPVLDPPERR